MKRIICWLKGHRPSHRRTLVSRRPDGVLYEVKCCRCRKPFHISVMEPQWPFKSW